MLIVLILISVVLFIICMWLDEDMCFLPIVGFILKTVVLVIFSWKLIEIRVIDQKIELYSTQNKEIETKVEMVVKQHMEHENKTFTQLKTEDSYITLVTLYPELKADQLIQQEINLYEENNSKIIELKEQKINESIYKWWLYFGK